MQHIRNSVKVRPAPLVSLGALTGLAGIGLLFFALAATASVVSVEPENSSQIIGSSVIANGSASNGQAIQFSATSRTSLRTVSQWETMFRGTWASADSRDTALSTSGDSWDLYDLAYGVDGNTAMFRATGKTEFLDRSLKYITNVIATARVSSGIGTSQYRDSYLTWANHSHPELGDDGKEYPLFESYLWRYVADTLVAIHDNPTVYANSTYRNQYNTILSFTETNIFDKWYSRGVNSNMYRSNIHMAAHWAFISECLTRLTTNTTRLQRAQTIVDNINNHLPNYSNNSMRGQLQASANNSYFWSDEWGSFAHPGHDVAHANGFMAYVVASNAMGGSWQTADLTKFANTLNNVIWPGGTTYAAFVDGSGGGTGWFNDGFVKLGRVSPELQKRLENHTVGRGEQLYGNGALNAKLLGAL